jgi:hypothetical protein
MKTKFKKKNPEDDGRRQRSLKRRRRKKLPDTYFGDQLFMAEEYISKLEDELLRYNEYSEDYED